MIRIDNLSFQYPSADTMALEDIVLHIEKGSLFGLLGPNGAGKTTLISLLVGILKGFKGHIQIGDCVLPVDLKKVKSLIGYVPQDYAFYDDLTALENLQFFAGVQGLTASSKQQRIDYCLDFCQLQSVVDRRASTFSGGLKRRLNIAIGLLNDPEIVFFDEPTVSIDPQSRAFILEQIKALKNQGKTIVYTSHYMEEVEKLCDYIAIIDHGKLLRQGTLQSLQQDYQQLSITFNSVIGDQSLNVLRSHFECCSYDNRKLVLNNIQTMSEYHRALALVENVKPDIAKIIYGKANLEEIFLELTNTQLRD